MQLQCRTAIRKVACITHTCTLVTECIIATTDTEAVKETCVLNLSGIPSYLEYRFSTVPMDRTSEMKMTTYALYNFYYIL